MRYVFIVNPKAGKKSPIEREFPQIEEKIKAMGIEYSVRLTEYAGHASEIVKEEAADGQPVRIIAVGGDGTLCEVANGAVGLGNVEIGVLPCGSGNDYLRTYGAKEDFMDVERLIEGTAYPIDVIGNEFLTSINICACGIDATVAMNMKKYKKWPMVSGSMAYNIALAKAFFGRIGNNMTIEIDGEVVAEGRYLLAIAACGRYYGGGYCAAPQSIVNDGLMDIVLIKKPRSRFAIPYLLGIYKRGDHIGSPKFKSLLTFCRAKKMKLTFNKDCAMTSDGECKELREITFELLKGAVNFIVPKNCVSSALAEQI